MQDYILNFVIIKLNKKSDFFYKNGIYKKENTVVDSFKSPFILFVPVPPLYHIILERSKANSVPQWNSNPRR